ncbi:MAG TPA: hypothetical protein VFJ58_20640 [Armatimonadota bacterium]|nr:hypothetical protein [Armatimonadota bacterium]
MSVTLKLDLPEGLYERLRDEAGKAGQPPEAVALRCLESQIALSSDDPIGKFIGAFDSGLADLGANHDQYVGEAVLEKLRDSRDLG